MKTKEGIRAVVVEEDGNPAFTGAILYSKYQDKDKVESLLQLGDLYELGEKVEPSTNQLHYILRPEDEDIDCDSKKKTKKKQPKESLMNRCLQEGVTISMYRDTRVKTRKGILKQGELHPAKSYASPIDVYFKTNAEFIYIFDSKTETWYTYGIPFNTQRFSALKIGYKNLIKNLVYADRIGDLSKTEQQHLSYVN
ncbi:MAG: hypothetical protein RR313_00250 [Anaerovoracaceae bacterium]